MYFPQCYTCRNNAFCNCDFNGALALLELTVLARVAGVGAEGVSSAGRAAGVSSVGAARARECTEKLASTSVLKLSKVSTSIIHR